MKIACSLSLSLLTVIFFFSGCGSFKPFQMLGTEDSSSTNGPNGSRGAAGFTAFKSTAYPLLRQNCASCHATIQTPFHSHADVNVAYKAALTKVSLSNPEESVLITHAGDGHCGTDNCRKHGAEIKTAVMAWLAAETTSGNIQFATNSRLRLGNRRFVASKLRDLFGASANEPVTALVARDIGNFGGPCDKYRRDFENYGLISKQNEGDCENIAQSQATIIGPNTSPRLAVTTRVCERILQNDEAVSFAVGRAVDAGAATGRRPSDGDLQSLYGLFFTGRSADSTVIDGLKTISNKARDLGFPNIESWRFSLIALCQSPDWQIP